MTPHRALNIAGAVAIVALFAAVQQMPGEPEHITAQRLADDSHTAQVDTQAQQRQWQHRRRVCQQYGGNSLQPAELPDGTYTCRTTLAQGLPGGTL